MELESNVCGTVCIFNINKDTKTIGISRPYNASECLHCKQFADGLEKHPREFTERETETIQLSMTINELLELLFKQAKEHNCSVDLKIFPIE